MLSLPTVGLQLSPVASKRGHNTLCLHLFGKALVKPMGQELEKAACVPVRGRTKQALTFFFRPIVRFTRFNRIEIWSLHVNANRYVIF